MHSDASKPVTLRAIEPNHPIPPVKNSLLAIWSLVLGCLTPCCFGPLAGIGAVICGHCAHSAIGKSGGTLGGRNQATIGLVLGYAGSVVWIVLLAVLMGLLFPAISIVKEQARRAEAKSTVMQVRSAVLSFNTEYGRYPLASSTSKNLTIAEDNSRLFDILRARPGTEAENPRHIVFFEGKTAAASPPKTGFGPDGVFYDPWGKPYLIRIDPTGDNSIPDPDDPRALPIQSGVAVWSVGNGNVESKARITSW